MQNIYPNIKHLKIYIRRVGEWIKSSVSNVDQIHRYTSGTFVYRSLSNPYANMFEFRCFAKNIRDSILYLLNVPFVTSIRCRQGISFRGFTIFNSIPLNIRNLINYDSLKIIYKRFILG